MAYQVVQWIRRHSPTRDANRAVLVVLAEHARRDGSNSYPSVLTIAAEVACSERTVQYALRALEEAGCIAETGRRRSGTKVWQVLMTDAAKAAALPPRPRSQVAPLGVQPAAHRGAHVAPEPSVNGQRKVPIEVAVEGTGAGAQRAHGLHALRDAARHLSQHPALIGGGVR